MIIVGGVNDMELQQINRVSILEAKQSPDPPGPLLKSHLGVNPSKLLDRIAVSS
jgi:hypothetical protein